MKNKYFKLCKSKKAGMEYYELVKKNRILPYERIYQNGYFKQKNIYSAVFRFENQTGDAEAELLERLRMHSVDFRLLNREKQRYLILWEESETYEEFDKYVSFITEKMIKERFFLLNANERLRFLHEGYLLIRPEKSLNVADYINHMEECQRDFQFQDKCQDEKFYIEGDEESYVLLGIQDFPEQNEKLRKMILQILNQKQVCSCIRIFEKINDREVINKLQTLYMGLDSELVKMKRTDKEFYDLYYGHTVQETARYTFCGCIVLLKGSLEQLEKAIDEIKSCAKKNAGKIMVYRTDKQTVFEQMIGASITEGYTHILNTKQIRCFAVARKGELIENRKQKIILTKNIIQ